ncbi:hypothetical protein ACQ4M4_27050 [Leptolyngbya sp. AN02str]|uniref:hypothetical protein n=1 Tax=Leptolyngbya sp. AN02str TaxID=3423363 RepID=UPI003D31FEB9
MRLSELPGAELILPGLDDLLHDNTDTVESLLIAIAATRLTQAGLQFPTDRLPSEPELALYNRLQAEHDDPYPYYNALLLRLHRFCNAFENCSLTILDIASL